MAFRSFSGGERKMYKAVCSDCGQDCEVPFQPTEGKPVYCRECYQKHRRY
ncbi:MAG: CxxC-x17-CxxC domain-containing protein [Candidatus Diapherotrites archaeon]